MAVVICLKCGAKNRIDEGAVTHRRPVCAKCGTGLNVSASDKGVSSIFRKGDAIGPYTLVHRIGHGGFGEVWLGEKSGIITTRFALKLPKNDDIDSAIFKDEASVWLQASGHTNIVPIIEADVHPVKRAGDIIRSDQIVIVSEYLRDGSLQQRLGERNENIFSTETAVETALGILAGLKYLHTRQPRIIHRDLKPDNVLLQGDTPRLTDFGIARMLKTQSYSRTEHISGTLPYMAPEVFKGQYSPRTDIWAAGVILYQLISGRLPFPQLEIASLLWAIAHDEPQTLPAHVPGQLCAVVYQTLKKNPQERYQSADGMRQALVAAMSGHGNWQSTIPAPPPSPIPPVPPWKPEPTPPTPAPTPRPLPRATWIVAAVVVLLTVLGFVSYISMKPVMTASTQPSLNANTPSSNSQTNGNFAFTAANVDTPVVATGVVDFETREEPFRSPVGRGRITKWLVQPGDLVNQSTVIVTYTYQKFFAPTVEDRSGRTAGFETVDGSISAETMKDLKQGLVQVTKIREGEEFDLGQELCRIARILHVRVGVKLAPRDIARVPVGTNARFQTGSQMVFRGRVESVDAASGTVSVRLLDEDAFDSRGYLNQITPKMGGQAIFDVNKSNK